MIIIIIINCYKILEVLDIYLIIFHCFLFFFCSFPLFVLLQACDVISFTPAVYNIALVPGIFISICRCSPAALHYNRNCCFEIKLITVLIAEDFELKKY